MTTAATYPAGTATGETLCLALMDYFACIMEKSFRRDPDSFTEAASRYAAVERELNAIRQKNNPNPGKVQM